MRTRIFGGGIAAAAAALMLATACGKSNPGGPTTTTTTTSINSATTIVISNNAAAPRTLTVPVGTRVTFVNNDTRSHDMVSDPHPDHTGPNSCPELNAVGFLNVGESRQTGNLNTRRTCGFHDHNMDVNTNLQGSIIIQ